MSNYSESTLQSDSNSSWHKVLTYISTGSLVLDIGCSSGNFGQELIKKRECTVDGIELDEDDYLQARRKLRNVWRLNIETDKLDNIAERYDYIYFGDVIEHLVTPSKTLSRIKSLLKPEGQIVFSIPNMAHMSVRLMLLKGSFEYGETGLLDKTHLHFYDFNEVKRVFADGGYEITHLDPVLNDTPKELLQDLLADVGLKLTKDFLSFAKTSEASVYQFVGTAAPVSGRPAHKQLQIISPVNLNQKILDDTVRHFEKTIEIKDEEITRTKEQYAQALNELAMLKRKFRHINRVYRVAGRVKKVIERPGKS